MLSNTRLKVSGVLAALVLGGVMAPGRARAVTSVTNSAIAAYSNSATVAQASVTGSTVYTVESNPVLSVVKTRDIGSGPIGTVVTWTIRVSYPRIADFPLICGDDSVATAVAVTDAIPAAFTYNPGTLKYSTDDGVTFVATTDGVDADALSVTGSTVLATIGTMVEGQGDTVNCATQPKAIVFTFETTKN